MNSGDEEYPEEFEEVLQFALGGAKGEHSLARLLPVFATRDNASTPW
jgi:hypothetical protein